MDDKLLKILQDLMASEDNTGCSDDLTVVCSEPIEQLRKYLNSYLGARPTCKKCGSDIDPDGFCIDLTCPYDGWSQNVPVEMFNGDATTLDIFDECSSNGLLIKVRDEECRASSDLFECEDCGYTFDNDNSIRRGTHLYCVKCAGNHPSK